jgi:hypothetical protein
VGLQNLEELYLGNCWELGDDSLDYVIQLAHLQLLELNDTQVTDSGLQKLRKLTNLRRLILTKKLTDAEIADRKIGMGPGWGKSGWKEPRVTDAGVAALQGAMPSLTIIRP